MLFFLAAASLGVVVVTMSYKSLSSFIAQKFQSWPLDDKIGTIDVLSDKELRKIYQGKRILVVGGTRGVGFGVALAASRAGAKEVAIVGRSEAAGRKAVSDLSKNAKFIQGDIGTVANAKATVAKIEETIAQSGNEKYDYLVVTAAIFPDWTSPSHQQQDGIDAPFAIAVVGRYIIYKSMPRILKSNGRVLNVLASGEAVPRAIVDHELSSGRRDPRNLIDSIANFSCGNEVMLQLVNADPDLLQFTKVSTHPGMLETDLHRGQGFLFDVLEWIVVRLAGVSVEDCGVRQTSILASSRLHDRQLSFVSSDLRGRLPSATIQRLVEKEMPWMKEFLRDLTGL